MEINSKCCTKIQFSLLIACTLSTLFSFSGSLLSDLNTKLSSCITSSHVHYYGATLFSQLVLHLLNFQRSFYCLLLRPSFVVGNTCKFPKITPLSSFPSPNSTTTVLDHEAYKTFVQGKEQMGCKYHLACQMLLSHHYMALFVCCRYH